MVSTSRHRATVTPTHKRYHQRPSISASYAINALGMPIWCKYTINVHMLSTWISEMWIWWNVNLVQAHNQCLGSSTCYGINALVATIWRKHTIINQVLTQAMVSTPCKSRVMIVQCDVIQWPYLFVADVHSIFSITCRKFSHWWLFIQFNAVWCNTMTPSIRGKCPFGFNGHFSVSMCANVNSKSYAVFYGYPLVWM